MNAATATSGAASSTPRLTPFPVPTDPHAEYFARIHPEPYRILGLALKPLSVGRYRLMKRFHVAFVDDGDTKAGLDDLLLAVLICSMRVEEFLEFAASNKFQGEIRRWSRKIMPHSWRSLMPFGIGKRWRIRHGRELLQKIALFQRYITEHSQTPRYWDESDDFRISGAHWSHSIEVVLRGQVGWTEEEINERPITKALWDFYKYMETQGLIRLMTADEIEYMDTPATPEQEAAMQKWADQLQQAALGTLKPENN